MKDILITPLKGVYPNGFRMAINTADSETNYKTILTEILKSEDDLMLLEADDYFVEFVVNNRDILGVTVHHLIGVENTTESITFGQLMHGLPAVTMSSIDEFLEQHNVSEEKAPAVGSEIDLPEENLEDVEPAGAE